MSAVKEVEITINYTENGEKRYSNISVRRLIQRKKAWCFLLWSIFVYGNSKNRCISI